MPRDLVLNRRLVESEPGKVFHYKSGDTQTLLYIIENATGKNISAYTSEKNLAKNWSRKRRIMEFS